MELWDLYDKQRRPLGKTHVRGVPLEKGTYHLVVFAWVFSDDGKVLLTKRSPEKKSFPNQWENTGGSVLAGETSRQAIQRELFEETGIHAEQEDFRLIDTFYRARQSDICDIYFLQKTVLVEELVMQEGETCDARWVTRAEFEEMIAQKIVARPDVRRYYQLGNKLNGYFY